MFPMAAVVCALHPSFNVFYFFLWVFALCYSKILMSILHLHFIPTHHDWIHIGGRSGLFSFFFSFTNIPDQEREISILTIPCTLMARSAARVIPPIPGKPSQLA